MSPKERGVLVKKQKWCKRCLRAAHPQNDKPCDKVCKKCKKGHSTWLHEPRTTPDNTMTVAHGTFTDAQILLATAMIRTTDVFGQTVLLRVLIDSGAEGSLITKAAAAR